MDTKICVFDGWEYMVKFRAFNVTEEYTLLKRKERTMTDLNPLCTSHYSANLHFLLPDHLAQHHRGCRVFKPSNVKRLIGPE